MTAIEGSEGEQRIACGWTQTDHPASASPRSDRRAGRLGGAACGMLPPSAGPGPARLPCHTRSAGCRRPEPSILRGFDAAHHGFRRPVDTDRRVLFQALVAPSADRHSAGRSPHPGGNGAAGAFVRSRHLSGASASRPRDGCRRRGRCAGRGPGARRLPADPGFDGRDQCGARRKQAMQGIPVDPGPGARLRRAIQGPRVRHPAYGQPAELPGLRAVPARSPGAGLEVQARP